MTPEKQTTDLDIQHLIGGLLRWGVGLSMVIVVTGGIFYLSRHGQEVIDYSQFRGVPESVHTPSGIWHGIWNGRGRSFIQAGVILLIATPVVRVIFSAIGFIWEKDRMYTAITLLVLAIIVISAVGGHAG